VGARARPAGVGDDGRRGLAEAAAAAAARGSRPTDGGGDPRPRVARSQGVCSVGRQVK
jgi:hypothetical protein